MTKEEIAAWPRTLTDEEWPSGMLPNGEIN